MDTGRRGLTNGLGSRSGASLRTNLGHVNGRRRGATNGLRPDGKVNGLRALGRVNGLVNGSGFVNGLPLRRNAFGVVTHRDLRRGAALLVAFLVLMLVAGILLSAPVPQAARIVVDGDFTDWSGILSYPDEEDVATASTDLLGTAIHATRDEVFVYGQVRSPLFGGPEPTSAYVLLRRDEPASPAYAAPGLEAHVLAELWGYDGVLRGTSVREWNGSTDRHDGSAFRAAGGFPAAVTGTEFELRLDAILLGVDTSADVQVRVVTRSARGMDVGAVMGTARGALIVEQEPLRTTIVGEQPVLEVRMRAIGAEVRVAGLTVAKSGDGQMRLPPMPVTIPAGTSRTVSVSVDAVGLPIGSFLVVRVTDVDASADRPVPVTLSGPGARLYVDAEPAGMAVDGLFEDWSSITTSPDPDEALPDAIDVWEIASALQGGAFFFVRTEGDVLAGTILPERRGPIVPGGEPTPTPPVPIPRIAGEDVLRIYVDVDDADATGLPVSGILADRMLEARGRLGRITATASFAWDVASGSWQSRTEAFDVALEGARLEASAPLSFFGTMRNPRVAFAVSDWSGLSDLTEASGVRGTRGDPGVRPMHGSDAQLVTASPLTNVPVVDGDCATFGGEYNGASTGSTANLTFQIGRRSDTQHVFVCVEVSADGSNSGADWGELVFDTDHDGGSAPQTDDRRFRVYSGVSVLISQRGNGTDWEACDGSCDPSNLGSGAFRSGQQVYEFRIRFSDVWGTNSPSANQVAGFAVVALDADTGITYAWGSSAVDDADPDTWGHVQIPEFPALAVAVGSALLLPLLRRRRQSLYSARRMRTR